MEHINWHLGGSTPAAVVALVTPGADAHYPTVLSRNSGKTEYFIQNGGGSITWNPVNYIQNSDHEVAKISFLPSVLAAPPVKFINKIISS